MTQQLADQHGEIQIETRSPAETLELGRYLGARLHRQAIVALTGDLGSGKTWLAKGLAQGLGVPDREYVTSPAYDLVHEYQGRLPVYHIDFYRLDELSDNDRAWLEEYLYADGVCIIEWAEKFIDALADHYLAINLSIADPPTQRKIRISTMSTDYIDLLHEANSWRPSSE